MKAPKVRLYIRVRRADGKHTYVEPAWNRNRTLREGWATVSGKQEHHPEGVYYLRHRRDNKPVWQSVGRHADLALVAMRNKEHDLTARKLGRTVPPTAIENINTHLHSKVPNFSGPTVKQAIEGYIAGIRERRAARTISSCEHILGEFAKSMKGRTIESVERTDLLSYMNSLKNSGLSERTVFNHIARVVRQ